MRNTVRLLALGALLIGGTEARSLAAANSGCEEVCEEYCQNQFPPSGAEEWVCPWAVGGYPDLCPEEQYPPEACGHGGSCACRCNWGQSWNYNVGGECEPIPAYVCPSPYGCCPYC
jgi:hypothetical protein